MSDSDTTVIVEADEPDTVVVEESSSDDATDAVELAVEIQLVERVTRIEEALNTMTAIVTGLTEQMQILQAREEMTEEAVEETQEAVAEIATEAADAVEEVVEDIDEASEEIKPDELPAVRTHPFFRKWGRKS